MNSATSNIFVSDVDTVDFWRTNGSKLEAGPISPQRLRRNRLSKFRDDSKHFSPISTVLSFSHKVKYLKHTLASFCQMFSQNNMRAIYRTRGSDSDCESFLAKISFLSSRADEAKSSSAVFVSLVYSAWQWGFFLFVYPAGRPAVCFYYLSFPICPSRVSPPWTNASQLGW